MTLTSEAAGEPRGFAQRPSWVAAPSELREQVELICGSAVIGSDDVTCTVECPRGPQRS